MKVLNKRSFRLPYVETQRFRQILRLGVGYNRSQRSYHVKSYGNVEKIIDTISDILGGEEVSFLQACILCGRDFPCLDCKYNSLCPTRDLPLHCICPDCLQNGNLYDRYTEIQIR